MLDPTCEDCGGHLRPVAGADLERVLLEDAEVPHIAGVSRDATGVFAGLVMFPWLLPMFGVHVGDIVFLVPLVLLAFAANRAHAASRREPAWRWCWRALTAACVAAAAASVVAVASAVVLDGVGAATFYVGATASAALIVATLALAARALPGVGWERVVDALLLCLVLAAVAVYFVVVPGLQDGNQALTLVVMMDLVALVVAAVCAVALNDRGRVVAAWWLTGGMVAVLVGDSLVSASAAGTLSSTPGLTAVLWAIAGYAIASAAEGGFDATGGRTFAAEDVQRRWVFARVVLPLAAVLSFPAIGLWLELRGDLTAWGTLYFGVFFFSSLVLAFGRQALLLVEHRRNAVRERRLRHEALERNEELEALTGLATTMTQTLEEAPIVEQALGVLATAARASSAALHTTDAEGATTLKAATGAWHTERVWAKGREGVSDTDAYTRGGRAILHVALSARGHRIGTVTLLRPEQEPFDERSVSLLRLLVDQMGVAVQNARDYREKLEQAIRDPLTGLYNRRFLLETLEKEVQRAARYGSEASLVIFDVDDFKQINDTYGHAAGDEVLRRIGQIVTEMIRPVDSFARIGGEEFALLMPETPQMQALLVAERVRATIGRQSIIAGRRVTMSGGVASCPHDTIDAAELQRKADAALYWAKRNGKDLCAVASEVTADESNPFSDRTLSHLNAIVAVMDEASLQTRNHSENVASYAVALGQELDLDGEALVRLRRAAMLHDIGKIAIDAAILDKPAALTDEEYRLVQTHSDLGGRILARAGLADEAVWVRAHHERFDGNGYPDRLAGEAIPLHARIIFVADSFEAMTSDRPYRLGMSVADALAEVRACAGTQFDPVVVAALERLVADDRLAVMALRGSDTSASVS